MSSVTRDKDIKMPAKRLKPFIVLWVAALLSLPTLSLSLAADGKQRGDGRNGIENELWMVAAYFDGMTVIESRSATLITFINGSVQGETRCGAFGGNYYVSDRMLRIQAEIILDSGPCFEADLREASTILDALNAGERRIEQSANGYVLRDSLGAVRIVLRRRQ